MVTGNITKTLICNNNGEEVGRIILRSGTVMIDDELISYNGIYGLHAGEDINWDSTLLDETFSIITYTDLYSYACKFFHTEFKLADCVCV